MENLRVQGIYMILNKMNNKCYVGSSKFIKGRKEQHIRELRKNKHNNSHLQNAWNKYGKNSFVFIKLEEVDNIENLCEREIFWILQKDSLNSKFGYNLGIPKQSDNCSLRKETINKLLVSTYYQFHSDNPNITLEDFLNGKRAKDLKERFGHKTKKKVLCFNCKTGDKELEFESIADTAKHFNTTERYISRILNIENKTCRGFIMITEDTFNSSKVYKKTYKDYNYYTPKGAFKGNPIEVYNLETGETIQRFSNKKEMARQLNLTEKYIDKVLYKEIKSFKGKGIRLIKLCKQC